MVPNMEQTYNLWRRAAQRQSRYYAAVYSNQGNGNPGVANNPIRSAFLIEGYFVDIPILLISQYKGCNKSLSQIDTYCTSL